MTPSSCANPVQSKIVCGFSTDGRARQETVFSALSKYFRLCAPEVESFCPFFAPVERYLFSWFAESLLFSFFYTQRPALYLPFMFEITGIRPTSVFGYGRRRRATLITYAY